MFENHEHPRIRLEFDVTLRSH